MKTRNQLFLEFCNHKNDFEITHNFHAYMFHQKLLEDDEKKQKVLHIVLGKGFVYDYHKKHACVDGDDFWDAMETRFAKIKFEHLITNGDIVRATNYIYKPTKQRCTYFILTNPVGQIKSSAFFNIDSMYESIRTFDPEGVPQEKEG